jgi:ricin-type beta-trefoil lectin protein
MPADAVPDTVIQGGKSMRIRLVPMLIAAALAAGTLTAGAPAFADDFAFKIINQNSGKCLQPGSLDANAFVVQRTCTNTSMQYWKRINETADGWFQLQSQAHLGLCMDLRANSPEEVFAGTLVQVFYCSISAYWRFEYYQHPYYLINSQVWPLNLDVANASKSDNAVIQVYTINYFHPAQHFRFAS